jgi:hypothetical protein
VSAAAWCRSQAREHRWLEASPDREAS